MRAVILSWMGCTGPAYLRANAYRVHGSIVNSCCWIAAGVWGRVINSFVPARLIRCDTDGWRERAVGREPLCRISQSPACSQRPTRSRLRIWARRLVLSCRHPDKPILRWHLLRYRYVMDHFSQPCWSGLFIIICSGVISWTWENCLLYHSARNSLLLCNLIPGEGLGKGSSLSSRLQLLQQDTPDWTSESNLRSYSWS